MYRIRKQSAVAGALMILGFLMTIFTPSYSNCEIFVGFNSGIGLPGDQDQKFKEYNSQGELMNLYLPREIREEVSLLSNVNISAWGAHDVWQHIGIQLDTLFWCLTTKAKDLSNNDPAPFTSIEQKRIAFFLNILGRVLVYNFANVSSTQGQTYLFGGLGGGPVYTDVQHGQQDWRVGYQFLGGVSIPLRQNLRFRIESRYLLVHDTDAGSKTGWSVDISGTPTRFRFGQHQDTRFFGVLVGVDWQFH